MTPDADGSDDEDDVRSVPLTDLFLALGACFLFALFLADPRLRLVPGGAQDDAAALLDGRLLVDGAAPRVMLAGPAGLRLPDGTALSLATLSDAPGEVAATLGPTDASTAPLLVAILPGGDEAAFLLDPILAATGGAGMVRQIRLDADCTALRAAAGRDRCAQTLAEAVGR